MTADDLADLDQAAILDALATATDNLAALIAAARPLLGADFADGRAGDVAFSLVWAADKVTLPVMSATWRAMIPSPTTPSLDAFIGLMMDVPPIDPAVPSPPAIPPTEI